MIRVGALLLILASPGALAQHPSHASADGVDGRHQETGLFLGLRVDPTAPPPGSSAARAFAFVEEVYLHVAYGSPFKRGRVVFGGLVGFGSLWSMGGHYAAELVVTDTLRVAGQPLEPGVYTLFATPEPSMWTLHINSVMGMHQADLYDPEFDVMTVRVPVETLEAPQEQFVIDFEPSENGVDMRVTWDLTRIRIPIRPMIRP